MSSSAFDIIARNWGDSVADRVRSHLSKQDADLPIRVRHAADFVKVSRETMASIFEGLERASVLRAAVLPLCGDCDEVIEHEDGESPECDLCGKVVRDGRTERCFFLKNPVLYAVPTSPSLALAELASSASYVPGEVFEDATWDGVSSLLPVDALLMTAVKVELQAVRGQLQPPPGFSRVLRVPCQESTYYLGVIGRYTCAVVMSDAGSGGRGGALLTLYDAISRLSPSFALAVGIAFGKDPSKQRLGDVLVSTIVIPYEPARVQSGGDVARAPQPEAGLVLLNRLRALDSEDAVSDTKIHFGALLSGEKLVDDAEFKARLFAAHPSAIGGEMEAAGIYAAAARNHLEWAVIKAICDWGDGKKNDKHQKLAATNACCVTSALLSRGGLERTAFPSASAAPTSPPAGELPEIEVSENPAFRSPRPGRGRRSR